MSVSFLKKGKQARREASAVDAERKRREEKRENEVRRFFVKRGTERRVTFLDGDLDADGELSLTSYYEHNLFMNGHWRNFFVCTGNEEEPCPICEEGKLPASVAVFSVIDHTQYEDRKGNKHKDQLMLLVAKRQTQKLLEYQAAKRKGLAGATFDVARMDEDQSPAVGTSFDYVDKRDIAKVLKKYGAEVINYEEQAGYQTPEELRKQGFGKAGKVGAEADVDDDDPPFDPDVEGDDDDDDGDVGLNIDDMDDDV